MGCRQVARQRFLEPLFVGLNPATPAKKTAPTGSNRKNGQVFARFLLFSGYIRCIFLFGNLLTNYFFNTGASLFVTFMYRLG